jgi:MFS transporter, YNFM family, putative membrane transport protein
MSLPASDTAAAVPATTRRSILLLSFATFCSMATQRICDAMLPELSRVFSVPIAQAAQVVSLFAVTYGVAQLWYGPLGDRYGKFRTVMLTTLACSVGSIAAALAGSLPLLVAARVVVALFAAAVIPLSLAWVGDAVAYERRQEMLAKLGLGSTCGIVGGQLIGGLFTDTLGWRWAFGFLTLLYLVVGALLWRDLRQQHARAGAVPTPKAAPASGFARQSLAVVLRPWSRVVLSVAFVEGAAAFGTLAIVASHLHARLGLALSAAGGVVAVFGLGGMFYMAVARPLIRRLGEVGLTRVGAVVFGLSFVALGYTPRWEPALLACGVAGFGFFMLHNTIQTNATQMAPEARGTGVTLFACALFLGQSVGVLVAASLMAAVGSAAVVAGAGVVLIALGWVFSGAIARRERVSAGAQP